MAAIHEAAEQGDIAEVERLLQANPDCLNQQGRGGWTPLHWASAGGHTDVVKLLLSKGADDTIFDKQGHTAMHWAGHYHDLAEVTLILSKRWSEQGKQKLAHKETAEAEEKRQKQVQSLDTAAKTGDVGCILQLLQESPDLINVNGDIIYQTPLLKAVGCGHIDAVRALLDKGANIEARTGTGHSALSLAAKLGHAAMVSTLIEHGANIAALCSQSRTPLHHAAQSFSPSTVQTLIDAGACINAQDERLQTPLHLAAHSSYETYMLLYMIHKENYTRGRGLYSRDDIHNRQLQIARSLLTGGADVAIQNYKASTPLHVAVGNGLEVFVQLLLDAGADVFAYDIDGKTPLDRAVSEGQLAVAELLHMK